MQSGDLLKAAEVFKGLLQLHIDKPLSFREKKMLDRARHMLVSEISIARGVPEIHGGGLMQRALGKSGLESAGQPVAELPAGYLELEPVRPGVRGIL